MDITLPDRIVHAYTGGKPFDPALPTVVFVHGALHDHSVWTLLARWFAHHGHSVLALDLPGHGRTPGPPVASVEDGAAWLISVLRAAGVERTALAGHSMGSMIALEAASRAPGLVSHLVLVGTAYPMRVSAALLATARERPLEAIDFVNAFSISTWAAKPSFPGPGMWLHGSNRALMRRTLAGSSGFEGRNLFEHDFLICDRYAGGLEAAARLRCPVTMILGAHDQMTAPKFTAALASALRARVVTLQAGHHLMAEQPDAMLAALREAFAATSPLPAEVAAPG